MRPCGDDDEHGSLGWGRKILYSHPLSPLGVNEVVIADDEAPVLVVVVCLDCHG